MYICTVCVCKIKNKKFISDGQGNKVARVDLQHAILSFLCNFIFLFFKLVNLNEAIKCFV